MTCLYHGEIVGGALTLAGGQFRRLPWPAKAAGRPESIHRAMRLERSYLPGGAGFDSMAGCT
jgi:hypothetical protein